MRIWVVGSQGMLGTAFLSVCKEQRVEAVGTNRAEADITNFSELVKKAEEIQPTHIVNCAAYTNVDLAEKEQDLAFAVNAEGAAHLAQAAKKCKARLIHISTDYVFNGKKREPYREEDPCDPINVYGKSKLAGEKKALEILPEACVIRTSWLFGAKGKNFISSVYRWLQEREELQVVSDQSGKPTYCNDLAHAVYALLDAEGIIHFANEGANSRYQIALAIKEIAKDAQLSLKCQKITPVDSAQFPTPAVRPAYTVLDTEKFYTITKQRPRLWNEALRELIL